MDVYIYIYNIPIPTFLLRSHTDSNYHLHYITTTQHPPNYMNGVKYPLTLDHARIIMSPLPFYIVFTQTPRRASESSVGSTGARTTTGAEEMKEGAKTVSEGVKREMGGKEGGEEVETR